MASRDKNGNFRGKMGNLTYRVINGVNVVQSRPGAGNTNMNEASLACSTDFGLASNRAKIMRNVLYPVIKGHYDSKMINRLNVAVAEVIRSNEELAPGNRDLEDGKLNLLNGFEFNLRSPFANYFKVTIHNELTPVGLKVSMPAFNAAKTLNFPPEATGCYLRILVLAINFATNQYCYCGFRELNMSIGTKEFPPTTWLFNENLPDDCLLIASASLGFYTDGLQEEISLNTTALHPATIFGVHKSGILANQITTTDPNGIWGKWFAITGIDGNKLKGNRT